MEMKSQDKNLENEIYQMCLSSSCNGYDIEV